MRYWYKFIIAHGFISFTNTALLTLIPATGGGVGWMKGRLKMQDLESAGPGK